MPNIFQKKDCVPGIYKRNTSFLVDIDKFVNFSFQLSVWNSISSFKYNSKLASST